MNEDKKILELDLLKRVLKYVKPYRKVFVSTLLLTIVLAALSISRPVLIQYTFDNFILTPDQENLFKLSMLMVGLLMIEAIAQFFFMYFASWLGQSVIRDIRSSLYKKILSFRLSHFDQTPIGALVTRNISDIETIAEIFSQGLLVIFGDAFKIIVILIVMFYTDAKLSLICLSVFPFLMWATRYFQEKMKATFEDERSAISRLNTFVQEHITGMNIVQIFNREKKEMEKFEAINGAHRDATVKTIWYFSIFLPVIEVISAVSLGLLVWQGGVLVATGTTVTLGTLISFILLINMLFRPVRQLADRFNTLQRGIVSSKRVFKVLDTEAFIQDNGTIKPRLFKGEVRFENVHFAYKDEEWILKNISFDVKAGETLALVGATGAGKSSVINLLSRFYDYSKGNISIDQENIKNMDLSTLRQRIAVVLQDVFLFSDSIYNNITLHQDISKEKVIEAAKFIGAHDFISALPGAYDYNVKERGAMLSVGQRQLIAFLRAYVSNPDILILDEATSSIDTHSEILIQQAIDKLTEGRTSIVIAHRLATIQKADKILVLDKGEIMESGTHQELLEENGFYTKLYEMQFQENIL